MMLAHDTLLSAGNSALNQLPRVSLLDQPIAASGTRLSILTPDCDCDCACTAAQPPFRAPLVAPVSCYFELTYVCPHHCVGCGNVFVDRATPAPLRRPLAADQWRVILDKLRPSVSMVRLTGGEPAVHPEFMTIVDLLDAATIPFALLTSGRWPQPVHLAARLARSAGFRGMLISLHGPDATAHEAFTATPGAFRAAVGAVRLAAGHGLSVATGAVMVQANLGRLRATADLALELGANHVVFNRYIGAPIPGFTLTAAELRAAMGEVRTLEAEGYPVRFGNCIPHCFEPSTSHGCSAGITYCTVDPWGNVRPCNHTTLTAGNLLSGELDAIWASAAMQAWRQMELDACRGCPAYATCLGGCRAMTMGPDPLMNTARPAVLPAPTPPPQLTLYAGAVPAPAFDALPGDDDACLVRDGRVLELPAAARPLLDDLFRGKTLSQLERDWGSVGLSIIAWLYLNRFIELNDPAKYLPVVN